MSQGELKNNLDSFSQKYLKKCARNIYSSDDGYSDYDHFDNKKVEVDRKDQFYGVYKHPKMLNIDKIVNDEFFHFD